MSVFFIFSLYFMSFIPLWISVLFIDVMSIRRGGTDVVTEWLSIGAIIVGCIVSICVIGKNLKNKNGSKEYTLVEVKVKKLITSEFLLSYILPLFAFDFTMWDQVVLFLVFFVTIGGLIIKYQYFCENVYLEYLGYRFYECELRGEGGKAISRTIISKNENLGLKRSQTIKVKHINNDICHDITDWGK